MGGAGQRFRDRVDAGRRLAALVRELDVADPVVLALPRGGVPVAAQVAAALAAPLDVFVARKVGAPHNPEYGMGAIAEGGGVVANQRALDQLHITPQQFEALVERERQELDRRVAQYRAADAQPTHDRTVVLVDDGLATGVTAEAALRSLRATAPSRLILAVPVCAPATAARLTEPAELADEVVSVVRPADFFAVGQWYDDFTQTTDAEVRATLAARPSGVGTPTDHRDQEVSWRRPSET